jgi:hypothetical protein
MSAPTHCTRPHADEGTDAATAKTRLVLASILANESYTMYEKRKAVEGEHPVCKATWYSHMDKCIRAVNEEWDEVKEEYIQQLLLAGKPIVVAADGAWSHRFSANQHEWTIMNVADNTVILSLSVTKFRYRQNERIDTTGNYEGTSKSMEICAMNDALDQLQNCGLLKLIFLWVADKDASAAKLLRSHPGSKHILLVYDAGHIKKNFIQMIKKLVGQKKCYHGIAMRMGIFWMRIVKRAEGMDGTWENRRQQAVEWMRQIIPHYTQQCGRNCPHLEKYGNLELDQCGSEEEEEDNKDQQEELRLLAIDVREVVEEGEGEGEEEEEQVQHEDDVGEEDAEATMNLALTLAGLGQKANNTIDAATALFDVHTGDREVRKFFDPEADSNKIILEKIAATIEMMCQHVELFVHGYYTCNLERFHSERTVYTNKRVEYWKNWQGLVHLSAMLHNLGFAEAVMRVMRRLHIVVTQANELLLLRVDRGKQWHKERKSSVEYSKRRTQLVYETKHRKPEGGPGVMSSAGLPAYNGKEALFTMKELTDKLKKERKSRKKEAVYADAKVGQTRVATAAAAANSSHDKENANPNTPAITKRKPANRTQAEKVSGGAGVAKPNRRSSLSNKPNMTEDAVVVADHAVQSAVSGPHPLFPSLAASVTKWLHCTSRPATRRVTFRVAE